MKRILLPIFIAVYLVFSSCFVPSHKVNGSGDVIEEQREVFAFDKINIDGVVNVILIQGDKEQVIVETDDNLQPLVHVYNKGNTLIVDTEDNEFKSSKNNVYITFKNLSEVHHNGVGNVTSKSIIEVPSLYIKNGGVGNAKFEINCDNLTIKQSGVGSMELTGTATSLELKNSGVGSVDSYGLSSDYANVINSGVGSTKIFVNKELSIKSTGVGSVKYKGDAVIKSIETSGIGSVKKD